MASAANTYFGPWINWEFGAIRGSTLTLSAQNGALLLAFVALFVALAANALWRIVAFTTHQVQAARRDHDALHHQHQVILRITESPGKAAWEFMQLIYYWRKRADSSLLRSLGMTFLALFCLAVLGVAGVFSARIVSAYGQHTLIISDHCGLWLSETQVDRLTGYAIKLGQDTLAADAYARECYGTDESAPQCSQYYKGQIPFRSKANVSCPFSSEICRTLAFEMDTGLVSSFHHLGWNTPDSQRVDWRKSSSCAILQRQPYLSNITIDTDDQSNNSSYQPGLPGDKVGLWYYGPLTDATPWTFAYNRHTTINGFGYGLTSQSYQPNGGDKGNTWTPIDALRREDAETTIVFLNSNNLRYVSPNSDPLFLADKDNVTLQVEDEEITFWESYYLTVPMACTDQYQFCNPNNATGFNSVQRRIARIIDFNLRWTNLNDNLNGRGSSALRAQDLVTGVLSQGLPDDQWQIELASWFATGLAKIQRGMLEYAAGPSNISGTTFIVPPADAIQEALCYSQMVPSARDTISFSIANLSIVLIVSALFILANLGLDTTVGFIQRKMNPRSPRRLQWILDDKFQLQRLAFEEAGMGEWSGGADALPVTMRREKFGAIPEDVHPKHPRLHRNNGEGAINERGSLLGRSGGEDKAGTTAETRSIAGS